MRCYDLALIGFGGVARALAELIRDDSARLEATLGFSLRVVAITDLNLGSLLQPEGIDLAEVLAMPRGANFSGMPGGDRDADNERVIRESAADIVVEATFTNPATGEPALSHVRSALQSGKHVVTTNKGPVALAGAELAELAGVHGRRFEFEGAVMSGTPVIRFAQTQLAGTRIASVTGILNGTSNYILGRLGDGLALQEAIGEAQALGYAEADPTADIGGSDVRLKVAILAEQVMGVRIPVEQIPTTGITEITGAEVTAAAAEGKRWKLLGTVERHEDGTVEARVAPVALGEEHPLAGVSGATNAVTFDTDLLGQVTVSGPGAGRVETAYALLSDIIAIDRAGGR
ncbi:homoserine dehydrogenase [Leucobacter massiliensis]|uniref:Homoserine dehydrogenase n=1 Tax=Leucobacter massiliensis TaxID=1686285 RepID=A0A2S9QS80_9MICO|nr:homoserine dehydrogenase [Leucobacter massiliensis]PRI12445.1 homoserine dehydrogenase [Leucobacter massiliensis]